MAATETYTNDTGTWGWNGSGHLFCSTCAGRQEIRCPRTAIADGPFEDEGGTFWMCGNCDEAITARGTGHGKVSCPTCQR